MSSSGTKRARASDKDGGKRRARSAAPKKKDAGKSSRRKATDKKRPSTDKKRRSPASASGKKDSRSKSKSAKSTSKKVKEDDGEKEVKEVKVSARKIQVEWRPRMKFDEKTGEKVIDIKTGKQKYGWAVRTQPFRRLVNHYAREMTEKEKLPDMRLAAHVTKAIQSAVEEEMVEILRQASMMALHAKRTTVQKQDVSMTSRLQKPLDTQEADQTYSSVLSKRSSKTGSGSGVKRAPSAKRAKKPADAASGSGDNKDAKDAPVAADGAAAAALAPAPKKKSAPKKSKKAAGSDASSAAAAAVTDAFPIAASA